MFIAMRLLLSVADYMFDPFIIFRGIGWKFLGNSFQPVSSIAPFLTLVPPTAYPHIINFPQKFWYQLPDFSSVFYGLDLSFHYRDIIITRTTKSIFSLMGQFCFQSFHKLLHKLPSGYSVLAPMSQVTDKGVDEVGVGHRSKIKVYQVTDRLSYPF